MRFELDIHHRNVPDQILLNDLLALARRIGSDSPTAEQYRQHGGRYHPTTIIRRFKGWGRALSKANLMVKRHNGFGIDRDEALADLQRVAAILQPKFLTASEYNLNGRFSSGGLAGVFGSWNDALRAAGLGLSKRARIPEDELFRNLEEMWCALGRQPKYAEVERPLSKFAAGTYASRFGSWRQALQAFVEFANGDHPLAPTPATYPMNEPAMATNPGRNRRRSTPRAVNWRLRFLVMQRDGFRCRACGASPAATPGIKLHVDHRIAWSEGGETAFGNLQTLCETCNIGKSNVCDDPTGTAR